MKTLRPAFLGSALWWLVTLVTCPLSLVTSLPAQPSTTPTIVPLNVNRTTGAITGPVSAATFASANSLSGGGGISDGDKGDITVSASGATWTIDAGVVSLAKMADMATTSLLGRSTAGTGAPEVLSAAAARTLLGLVVGTNVQAYDADLTTYAGITPAANIQTFLGAADYAAMRTQLGLVVGTDVQAFDADLSAVAALSGTNTIYYRSASNTWTAVTVGSGLSFTGGTLTAVGGGGGDLLAANNLSDLASASTARTNLGLAIGTNVQAYDADLTTYAGITPAANVQSLLGAADYSAMRTQLSLVVGTNVQAYDADLTTYAGITPAANIQTFLGAADYSAMRTQLGLVIGTNVQAYDADLGALSGLTSAADKLPYFTGSATAGVTDFTAFARTLLDDATAAAARVTLGLDNYTAHGNAGASEDFSWNTAWHSVTLDQNTTFTDSDLPSSGVPRSIVIEILQDGTGGRTIDWSAITSNAPTISSTADSVTIVQISTRDGATTVYATSTADTGGALIAANNLSDVASASTSRTNLGLAIGTNVQAYDADLTTYAGITPSANIQTFLGAADYSAMRTQLSLVVGTNVQAYDADLTTYAGITPSANIQSFLGAADYSAMRTQLGLVIGTNVQAYDADLTTWAGVTPASGVATALATPSSANLRSALTDEVGTGAAMFTRTGVVREVWIGAGAMTPATTAGAATGSYTPSGADAMTYDVLDFDDTSPESASWTIAMPAAWDRSTVKIKVYWTSASGTGTVVWGLSAGAASDDDALGALLGTEVEVTDTLIATDDIHISSATGAITVGGSPALDDIVLFKIDRDPAEDGKAGDARLLGVKLQFTESTTEPTAW